MVLGAVGTAGCAGQRCDQRGVGAEYRPGAGQDAQQFHLLRRASQRTNVPVSDLTAQLVAGTAQAANPPSKPARGQGPKV
jgi:hypothetical protein